MARWKKYPDLERRILLELLDSTPDGSGYTQLFNKLRPGSRTTLTNCLRSLVAANLVENDYLTKNFKITELGRQVIKRAKLKQREMELLVESGVFKERGSAVEAAIHLWFGLMNYHQSQVDLSFLPVRMNKDGRILGIPETEKDWKTLENASNIVQKVKHDVDDDLVQSLQALVKKYRSDASMELLKSKDDAKKLWEKAWPKEAIDDLFVAFASDKQLANTGIGGLRGFLQRTYPDGVSNPSLRNLTYERIQTFKKNYRDLSVGQHRWGGLKN